MRIPRVYINKKLKPKSNVALDKDTRNYLFKVLRLKENNKLTLFNSNGFDYPAKIKKTNKNFIIEILAKIKNNKASSLNITILQGIAKGSKMDLIVKKATELGANKLVPLITSRTIVKLNEDKAIKRQKHWQKIAISSSEQCGRATILKILKPIKLDKYLAENTLNGSGFILHPKASKDLFCYESNKNVTILIGPEGGLSDFEADMATVKNFKPLLLTNRILRTETAAVVAISQLDLLWRTI